MVTQNKQVGGCIWGLIPLGQSMAVGDPHVFPGFLTSPNTTFFTKPPTTSTFLTYFSRGERQKYTGKTVWLNRVLNSQPPRSMLIKLEFKRSSKFKVSFIFITI